MSDQDNNNNNEPKSPLSAIMAERAALAVEKKDNIRALKAISNDSKWNLLQEILQEIVATYVVENPDKRPAATQLAEDLRNEVKNRYENEPEKKDILMNAIPNMDSLRKWLKAEGFEEAVWEKAKMNGLFSKERRASMINALFVRGVARSDIAAKMYLTMSGDYSERADGEKDRVADTFREINKLLHKKNGA